MTGNWGGYRAMDIGVQTGTPQMSVQLRALSKSYPHSAAKANVRYSVRAGFAFLDGAAVGISNM